MNELYQSVNIYLDQLIVGFGLFININIGLIASECINCPKNVSFNEILFHRVQILPRAQILQEFRFRCQELAANDNRGFKQEFEVMSQEN